nr:peptidoglycan-binding domain-containing protein [Streptomyces taklimakanensis]
MAPNVTVSYGSSNHSAVKCAQYMLAFGGFYHGALDGLFGPQTLAAVKEFQRRNGLVVDGIVGPRTWGELERMVNW